MRSGRWKLHEFFEDGRLELYDLEADPGERTNLADSDPARTAALHAELVAWRSQTSAPVPTRVNLAYDKDADAAEQLRRKTRENAATQGHQTLSK